VELVTTDNLFSFFYDRVRMARQAQGAEVDDQTEFYLVNLLVDYGRTVRLFEVDGRRVDDLPLAIRLLQTRSPATGDRLRQLKQLADSTLYVLGFFSDSLRRSTVNLGYYLGLGETAYSNLAAATESRLRSGGDCTFRELAEKFPDCVGILNEVAVRTESDSDLLALYETWMETGSEYAERRLRALGLLPDTDKPISGGSH